MEQDIIIGKKKVIVYSFFFGEAFKDIVEIPDYEFFNINDNLKRIRKKVRKEWFESNTRWWK